MHIILRSCLSIIFFNASKKKSLKADCAKKDMVHVAYIFEQVIKQFLFSISSQVRQQPFWTSKKLLIPPLKWILLPHNLGSRLQLADYLNDELPLCVELNVNEFGGVVVMSPFGLLLLLLVIAVVWKVESFLSSQHGWSVVIIANPKEVIALCVRWRHNSCWPGPSTCLGRRWPAGDGLDQLVQLVSSHEVFALT